MNHTTERLREQSSAKENRSSTGMQEVRAHLEQGGDVVERFVIGQRRRFGGAGSDLGAATSAVGLSPCRVRPVAPLRTRTHIA